MYDANTNINMSVMKKIQMIKILTHTREIGTKTTHTKTNASIETNVTTNTNIDVNKRKYQ